MKCVCEQCGNEFSARPAEKRKFCGKACYRAYEEIHGRPTKVEPIRFVCKHCGKEFFRNPGELRSYRKQWGKDPLYCSMPCSDEGRKKDAEDRNTFTCKNCGVTKTVTFYVMPNGDRRYHRKQQFCGHGCKAEWQRKVALDRFNSGDIKTHTKRGGYQWVSVPALANGGKKGGMLEHRYVMERHLGRELLPEETVHHKDGDRQHNTLDNLELFTSRHGPGQRVTDQVAFAIDMLRAYPEFAEAAGVKLVDVGEGH